MGNLSVLYLELSDNALSGSIPSELGGLDDLATLKVARNNLTGSIPESLGSLTSLKTLDLAHNSLTGNIPDSFVDLLALENIWLNNNELTGSLPDMMGFLPNLRGIYMQMNQIGGTLPGEFGNLSNLQALYLGTNQLEGLIPATFGNLSNLNTLSLSQNNLTGDIPETLGNLTNLKTLILFQNQLSGPFPTALTDLTALETLNVSQNNLNGTLPNEICNLTADLNLNLNEFCLPYPVCIDESEFGQQDNLGCPNSACYDVTCPDNRVCVVNSGGGISIGTGSSPYSCECADDFFENSEECVRVGSSCESILSVEGNSPDGIYFLSTPSVMPTMCDMSTDDGGWTAFYLSTNGEPAAGALSFEGETTYGYGPSDHDLQFLFGRPPEDITTDSWFMAQCGDKSEVPGYAANHRVFQDDNKAMATIEQRNGAV